MQYLINIIPYKKSIGWRMYVCGSTGEEPSLTRTERKAEVFVKTSRKRVSVPEHVGHNSVKEARELSWHAQKIGADYVSSVAPSYFEIGSVAGNVMKPAARCEV